MAEMNFDPKSYYLTPAQEAVGAFLGTTNHWRTPREVALATGMSLPVARDIIVRLSKLGLVQKRKRKGGFDNGLLEFKGRTGAPEAKRARRGRAAKNQIIGFEPLHLKLQKILGNRRAREAESILKFR